MGKKKSSEDVMRIAQGNSFDDNPSGIDDRTVMREIQPYTGGLYETQRDPWST
jgi:hypothetical protein